MTMLLIISICLSSEDEARTFRCSSIHKLRYQAAFFWSVLPTMPDSLHSTALHCTASYYIISYHIISYHIISYHIILYHIISYHIISYYIISYYIISYHIISYHIMSYCIISYHIILYHILDRHWWARCAFYCSWMSRHSLVPMQVRTVLHSTPLHTTLHKFQFDNLILRVTSWVHSRLHYSLLTAFTLFKCTGMNVLHNAAY